MELAFRKLPKTAIDRLFRCSIASVKPFALMVAPVYIYMPLNQKFVAIKGPFDFFTDEELRKWARHENFYVSDFVEVVKPFQEAAHGIRSLLEWEPASGALGPTPYELSDAVLRMLGPLWGKGASIEPFFSAVLAHELCGPMPKDLLLSAREQDVETLDRALILAGWTVFLGLHLGYLSLPFLRDLRGGVFRQILQGGNAKAPFEAGSDAEELAAAARAAAPDPRERVKARAFETQENRAAARLGYRLQRIAGELVDRKAPPRTIYGEEGFLLHG